MGNNVTVTARDQSAAAKFLDMLDKNTSSIQNALPRHMNAERIKRIAMTQFRVNKELQKCSYTSIMGSLMVSAQLGLEIGILGQAYLIPYKGTCTFVPGWQGLVDLVSRAGRATVWTGAVFKGDEFDYALGDRPYIKHRPAGDDDIANLTHVYAVGRVNGQEWPIIEVWPIRKVIKHRDNYNKVGKQHYSYQHLEMYARKVALLQVLKYVPKSIELISAMTADHAYETARIIDIDKDGNITGYDDEPEDAGNETPPETEQPKAAAAKREPEPEPDPPAKDPTPPEQKAPAQKEAQAAPPIEDKMLE